MDDLFDVDYDDNFSDPGAYAIDEPDSDFKAEVTAFDRVGPGGKLASLVSGVLPQKKGGREAVLPRDRFLINLDATARRINSDNITDISEQDINTMLEKAASSSNIEYFNPVAFILGYLASEGGRGQLKQTTVNSVIKKILPKLKGEGGVEPPDIIRYARWWILH